ncbi:MBL fold metallo-hydrolase [Thalassomonas actiniarum]|uniref:MBL fold metallo-hydrolase n=1 Tax=Thalassomonas actiniarum TaxID=485447 RepID=A0AAE9YPJ0_9GAMM|nr:MBL fold metallo-hydrolase [Thalassomonas actiniarum]WDD98128.1 MBL fold metallo-hydrolase [Thalassomonas actiniarum]
MRSFLLTLGLGVLLLGGGQSFANRFASVKITAEQVAGNVYMLQGAGGNIAVLATDQGLLMVDDQFAPLAERIETAMKGIGSVDNPGLKYIVNTHFHKDHTGGNANFAAKAPIFAHENVRQRVRQERPDELAALPVVTYQNGLTVYLADEEIQITHLPGGHTDGDSVVYFKKANVLHTGDLFFELGFPYVDLKHGGNVKAYLANVNALLDKVPDDVKIIPGHGKLTDKARYKVFARMIDYSIKRVSQALAEGKSEQEILAMGIGEDYQHWSWSFINEERWLQTLISDLK